MAEVDRVAISAYDVPTVAPESDGTAEWNKTTLVLAELSAGGEIGLGYTYADLATARCSTWSGTTDAAACRAWRSPLWTWRAGI